ncbi:hypothetical protein ATCC90586_002160 [Pythium insidiosum]|nr:hypothetical protein ATCC90586_002160 [Pythium insidiosum]
MASAHELFDADDDLALASLLLADERDAGASPDVVALMPDADTSLAMLTAVDGMLSGLTSSSDDDVQQHPTGPSTMPALTSEVSVPPPRRQQRRDRDRRAATTSRQRQKDELSYLRAQVCDLEQQLNALKHCTAVSSGDADSASAPTSTAASAWERIARNQMCAKQKAELENIKLREMLEGQLKIARGLEKLLRKRACTSMISEMVDSDRRKRCRALNFTDDETVFEHLEKGLDHWYSQTDDALHESGLASQVTDLQDSRVRTDPLNEVDVCLEIIAARVFPFEFERVSAALLQCLPVANE